MSLHDMLTEHLRLCSDCALATIHARPVANLAGRGTSPMCAVYQEIIYEWAKMEAEVNHISPPIPASAEMHINGFREEEDRELAEWRARQETLNKE